MPRLRQHLAHLLPATLITACFAAVAHAIAVAVAARSVGLELLLIGGLSFVVTLVLALPGGAMLLSVTALLRLKPWASLLLFVLTIQAIAIGVELYLFESTIADISWIYGVITVPAALLAWRVSAYPAYLEAQGGADAQRLSRANLCAAHPAALQPSMQRYLALTYKHASHNHRPRLAPRFNGIRPCYWLLLPQKILRFAPSRNT